MSIENILENDAEYTRLFGQLTQQELGLINGNSPQAALEQINIALQTVDRQHGQVPRTPGGNTYGFMNSI